MNEQVTHHSHVYRCNRCEKIWPAFTNEKHECIFDLVIWAGGDIPEGWEKVEFLREKK